MVVAEEGGRRVALLDLLKIRDRDPAMRIDLGIGALGKVITAAEVRPLNAVKLSVITEWPSVSYNLARRLLYEMNRFILERRKSQAVAEVQFVEVQVRDAESALRAAEDRLQSFLQQNRTIGSSPELLFERDRIQRAVTLRQQVYLTLLQNREEARIREVRDTPVITVLEDPRLPLVGEPRNSLQKGVVGGIVGGILGIMIAFLFDRLAAARGAPSEATQEFFDLLREVTPRFLKRRQRL